MKGRPTAVLSSLAGTLLLATGAFAFPTIYPEGVTIHEPGIAEGYVLYGAQNDKVYLVDDQGAVVHEWSAPCGWQGPQKTLAGGHILTQSCSSLVELDWSGTVVWEYVPPLGVEVHHDWERLPNGNTMILCNRTINDPAVSNEDFLEDFIVEVSPTGAVVWDWYEADHFAEFSFSQERTDLIWSRGGDWSHATSVASIPDDTSHTDPRFSPGNIVIGLRHQNTLAVIDRGTGQIVWALTDEVVGPHAAEMIPDALPGGGNILVLDNGHAADWSVIPNRESSAVVEIEPVSDSVSSIYQDVDSGLPRGSFFNPIDGGTQRQSNGNTLITEGSYGRIFEVTAGDQIVWEYLVPFKHPVDNLSGIYRAVKVPLDWAAPNFVPDLVVFGDSDPSAVQPGGDVDYVIQLQNNGPNPAVTPELVTATPPDTTFREFSAPVDWNCSTPAVGGSGSITCAGAEVSVGPTTFFTLTVRADPCIDEWTTLSATVTVSSAGTDANPGDNSTTIDTAGEPDPALVPHLTAGLSGDGQDVELDWSDSAPACGYRVLRSTAPDGGFADVSGALADNIHVDVGAGSSLNDFYYLIAITASE